MQNAKKCENRFWPFWKKKIACGADRKFLKKLISSRPGGVLYLTLESIL